jgi:hypothetical protein
MDNNFSAHLIDDQGLRVNGAQVAIDIRLPWYRSLPLSTIEIAGLRVDQQDVSIDRIQLELNGKSIPASQFNELTSEWWYVLDNGTLRVAAAEMASGPEHLVELTLNLYPPYMPGFTWVTHSSKCLTAH